VLPKKSPEPAPLIGRGLWLLAIVGAIVLGAFCRFDHALAVMLVATIGVLGASTVRIFRGRPALPLALAHLLAIATWLAVDRVTTVAADYYKFWGGTSRRMKDVETAEHAYRRLVEIAPDEPSGHFQL